MFNMEVSKYDDPMKFSQEYQLSWICNDKKVSRKVTISKEMILQMHGANEMITHTLTHYMDEAIHDIHGDTTCEWCVHARYSLRVIIQNSNAGVEAPVPFWKNKEPVMPKIYIGGDDDWEELGHLSAKGIKIESEKISAEIYSAAEKVKDVVASIADLNNILKEAQSIPAHPFTLPPATRLNDLARQLPGVEGGVKCPCDAPCFSGGEETTLFNAIMHLNDNHKWTREQIADWLDSVDDPEQGIDLAFSVPEKEIS